MFTFKLCFSIFCSYSYSSDVLQFAKNLESWFKISLPSSVNKVKLEGEFCRNHNIRLFHELALHYFQRSIKQQLNLMELTKVIFIVNFLYLSND